LKKAFFILGLFTILSSLCWAGGKKEQKDQNTQPKSIQQPTSPVFQYWEGEGGKGMRLGIRVPESQGLNPNQAYLPTVVQGVLVSNISKYSAIDVVDRISLDKIIAETLDPTFKDDMNIARLGHIEQPGYWMTGNIVRTSTSYTLQINVTDTTPNANTVASYNGVCTAVQFDDHSAIHRASLELLTQMGVQLTDRAKSELEKASTPQYVNAQSALSRGIVAQQQGTVVEALNYYYEATSFDPSVLEAANRASVMTTTITSGNIGENVRNDIQLRNEWLKILREAATFFKDHPPYEIVYDPNLIEGNIDYTKETVDIYCNAGLRIQKTGNKIIIDLTQGLKKTGKSVEWGLQNWPDSGEAAIFIEDIQNYRINMILVNESGVTIGNTYAKFNGGGLSFTHDYGTLTFRNVNASTISNNLKVSITSINGVDAKAAGEMGYINTIPASISFGDIFEYDSWRKYLNGSIEYAINGYSGTHNEIVIPSVINGIPVTKIWDYAFYRSSSGKNSRGHHSVLTSVVIPNGIKEIGRSAFDGNQLSNIVIPNSVIFIESGAFCNNQINSVSIPANVRLGFYSPLSEGVFDKRTYDYDYFNTFYDKNEKKGGTYIRKRNGSWSYNP